MNLAFKEFIFSEKTERNRLMTEKKSMLWGFLVLAGVITAGCSTFTCSEAPKEIKAAYTAEPVKMDGTMDSPAWSNAPEYNLQLPCDQPSVNLPSKTRKVVGCKLREAGTFKVLWNDKDLYIGVNFKDSDVVADGEEDQMHHYSKGDVLEVFLKPEDDTYYWEMYATPAGKKTAFFLPGRGRLFVPDCEKEPINISVASKVSGTLNNWQDKDGGWTAVMKIPASEIKKYGAKFGPGTKWRLLVARYNYSRYLPFKELSSCPKLERTNYHSLEEYGILDFVK